MDGNTSLHFHETERRHHPSTHPQIPRHNKTLYCAHGCLRQCLRSSALTDAQRNQIPSSLPITYIHRYPMKMEYTRTRSVRHLFRHQEMELLPTRSRHYSKKQLQAFSMVPKLEERKHEDQQMGTRTCLL